MEKLIFQLICSIDIYFEIKSVDAFDGLGQSGYFDRSRRKMDASSRLRRLCRIFFQVESLKRSFLRREKDDSAVKR